MAFSCISYSMNSPSAPSHSQPQHHSAECDVRKRRLGLGLVAASYLNVLRMHTAVDLVAMSPQPKCESQTPPHNRDAHQQDSQPDGQCRHPVLILAAQSIGARSSSNPGGASTRTCALSLRRSRSSFLICKAGENSTMLKNPLIKTAHRKSAFQHSLCERP